MLQRSHLTCDASRRAGCSSGRIPCMYSCPFHISPLFTYNSAPLRLGTITIDSFMVRYGQYPQPSLPATFTISSQHLIRIFFSIQLMLYKDSLYRFPSPSAQDAPPSKACEMVQHLLTPSSMNNGPLPSLKLTESSPSILELWNPLSLDVLAC